jgi:DNA-binding CsgD family transcriptional regulator
VGIYNVMFLVDVLAMSLGVGIMFVSLLSWERSGILWLRDLAFITVAGTVYLVLDILRLYDLASGWPPAAAGRPVLAVLSATGNFVLAYAIPAFAHDVAPPPPRFIQRVFQHICAAVFALAGALDELFDAPGFHIFDDVMMAGLLVAAAVLLAVRYRRIVEPETRTMVRRMMWLTIASIVLSRGQLVATSLLGVPPELRRVRIVPVFYYLSVLAVMLLYSVRYLFRPSAAQDFQLSREFMGLYGISKRERDIITMIVQGHPNRVIGERLFISDRTVKNHVSSIYRKTGAANKVQLLNMVRNTPGDRSPSDGGGASAPGGRISA